MRWQKPSGVFDRVEKWLMRMVIITAVALVLTQSVIMKSDPFTSVMARVGSETMNTAHWNEPRITLYLDNYSALPHLSVLINGKKVSVFSDRYVTIPVQHGDFLEIDGTFYNHSISVKVLNTTEEISLPQVDKELAIESNVVPVGTVKLKH